MSECRTLVTSKCDAPGYHAIVEIGGELVACRIHGAEWWCECRPDVVLRKARPDECCVHLLHLGMSPGFES